MFEAISRIISTAIFFLCAAVITGLPTTTDTTAIPTAAAVSEAPAVSEASAVSKKADEYSLVGMWNSGGKTFEFTPDGKLIFGDVTLDYTKNGDTVTIVGTVDGKKREYTVELVPISERVARLNGIKMYRIK